MIGAVSATSASPTAARLTPNDVLNASAIAFACTALNTKPNARISDSENSTPKPRERSPIWM